MCVPASFGCYIAHKLIKTPCGQCPALEADTGREEERERGEARQEGGKSCRKVEGTDEVNGFKCVFAARFVHQ